MKFKGAELMELDYGSDGPQKLRNPPSDFDVVHVTRGSKHRWYWAMDVVFTFEGKLYSTVVNEPLSEMQDWADGREYDADDDVECPEVFKRTRVQLVTDYVKNQADAVDESLPV
jgi:hypothetical protein